MTTGPNPYEPPGADLTAETAQPRRAPGVWWKIYFFLMLLLTFASLYRAFHLSPDFFRNFRLPFVLVLYTLATTGLGGYVFRKKIFSPRFWRYFFYLYLLTVLINFGLSLPKSLANMGLPAYIGFLSLGALVGLLLALPTYIALYRYGSPDEHPWRNKE